MSSDQILSQVLDIMEDAFDVDDLSGTPVRIAEGAEEWHSFSHIRLIVVAERKIKFKTAEVQGLKNAGDLVNLVGAKAA
jgi:acyl carrier protein